MKRQILLFLLQIFWFYGLSQAQNLEGKWKGVLTIDTGNFRREFQFSIQLKQTGRAVWGIYVRGADITVKNADCIGRLTAGLTDKENSGFTLFNDGTESGNMTFEMCQFFYSMQAEYFKDGQGEYLNGKWFGTYSNRHGYSLPEGIFKLEKVSPVPDIDVDKYFPGLARLIKKFNSE
jgi:hypothetical protein